MARVTRNGIQLAIIGALVVVLAAFAIKFVVLGSTVPGESGRSAVQLSAGERALVLREMRGFVSGLQAITDGLARDDMTAVAQAARNMGMARSHDAPVAMLGKLPLAFKSLAFEVHRGFDAVAADADTVRAPKHTLAQLSGILGKCAACHASYEIRASQQ